MQLLWLVYNKHRVRLGTVAYLVKIKNFLLEVL